VVLKNALPIVLLGWAGAACAGAQGVSDPVFAAVPFNRWLADGEQTRFRWTTRVLPAELNSHQRLLARAEIQVDGSELVSRRGHGQLVMLIQFRDSAERSYQAHGIIDLQDVKDEAAKSNIVYDQEAFVLPGDYRVDMVIFDAKTGEHSAAQKTLHVNSLRNDPLPAAWKDLPAVELPHGMEAPDAWFRPDLAGRLQLSVNPRRPIRVEVLMNAAATGPVQVLGAGQGGGVGQAPGGSQGLGVGTVSNRGLANVVPALKVLSHLDVKGGSLRVTLLDIPKRRVIFEQDAVSQLDWPRMREALTEADPNKIDVRSLAHREQNAQFFVEQVRQRLGAASPQAPEEPFRVLIVLSGPTTFNSGEDMRPIELNGKPNAKVYYVRYHLPPERLPVPSMMDPVMSRGRRNLPGAGLPPAAAEPFDSLVSLLKPLQPRVFDVYTPDQFRKALSSLLEEIARL
jgi:hypothetical protein